MIKSKLFQKCCRPDALILPTDTSDDSACWKCSVLECGATEDPGELNQRETELAKEVALLDNFNVQEFEKCHERLKTILHPNHYLMVLLKRHMVGLYSGNWTDLNIEDMERVSKGSI